MLGLLKLVNFGLKKICMNDERTKITIFCVCACVFKKKKKEPYGNNLFVFVLFPALIYTYKSIILRIILKYSTV